ncbi:MAG: IS1 family transposase [Emergencia sp.]
MHLIAHGSCSVFTDVFRKGRSLPGHHRYVCDDCRSSSPFHYQRHRHAKV